MSFKGTTQLQINRSFIVYDLKKLGANINIT